MIPDPVAISQRYTLFALPWVVQRPFTVIRCCFESHDLLNRTCAMLPAQVEPGSGSRQEARPARTANGSTCSTSSNICPRRPTPACST
jgi:hypothetical protein